MCIFGSLFRAILIALNALFGGCVCPSLSLHQQCPVNGLSLEIYTPGAEFTLIEISLGIAVIRLTTGGYDLVREFSFNLSRKCEHVKLK
jgi:hypothetical protein